MENGFAKETFWAPFKILKKQDGGISKNLFI